MSSDQKTEYDLIRDVINYKSSTAFSKLYEDNIDFVYKFVYSRVGNTHITEDIVSDTFETVIVVIETFNFKSKFSSFIIGIALNKIREFKRKEFKQNETDFEEEIIIEETFAENNPPKSTWRLVKELMNSLEKKYKDVLIERFILGKSIKETAKSLNITVSNAKVRQNRAIEKIVELAERSKSYGK